MISLPDPAPATDGGASASESDVRRVPWTAMDAILGTLLFLPMTIMIAGAILLVVSGVFWLLPGGAPSYLQVISFGAASFITAILLVWMLAIFRRKGTWAQVGLANFRLRLDIPAAFLGEITAIVGLGVYSFLLNVVGGLKVPEQPVVDLFGSNELGFALAIIFVAILAPIGEELFFRGFVYPAFRGRWGVGWGMVGSSAVFALFHVQPLLLMPMFIIGMVLAVLFEYRGSLMPCFILHGLNNLIALLVAYGAFGV